MTVHDLIRNRKRQLDKVLACYEKFRKELSQLPEPWLSTIKATLVNDFDSLMEKRPHKRTHGKHGDSKKAVLDFIDNLSLDVTFTQEEIVANTGLNVENVHSILYRLWKEDIIKKVGTKPKAGVGRKSFLFSKVV